MDGELVELDGFSASRPAAMRVSELPLPLEAVAEMLGFEDEPDVGDLYTFCPSGQTSQARLVSSRLDGLRLVLDHELPGMRIETTIRHASTDTSSRVWW